MHMTDAAWIAAALAGAWAIDLRFGEPRDAWHPVAWLGSALRPIGLALRRQGPRVACIGGVIACAAVLVAVFAAGAGLQALVLAVLPVWIAVPVLALALKPAFAWRMLRDEVAAVESTLAAEGEPAARQRLARLVSRDVQQADAAALRETAIETLSENLNDSVVAPLFWCVLFGLPGAWAYRAANTMDAMWGYRGAWEWAGKAAARVDDVLSWIPARLTALLLQPSLRRVRAEARRTPSPNGGWPMGAMALQLGVRLSKPGVYALNAEAARPDAGRVAAALSLATRAAWMAVALAVAVLLARALA